jgi:hypothetical protein
MATLQQRLENAETAYDELLTGRAVRRFVDQNGEQVEYTSANRSALAAYIADLKRQIGGLSQGPMRVHI